MSNNIYIVTASISILENIRSHADKGGIRDEKILIIDEGDEIIRDKNRKLLKDLDITFYGPHERLEWFKSRFGSSYEKYLALIPERSHAETSFGFLIAADEGADIVIEIDDDVYPYNDQKLVDDHIKNLSYSRGMMISSTSKWINTIDLLELNDKYQFKIFPRGHPYSKDVRRYRYYSDTIDTECVLNMGLWSGYPDLDAVTILANGGINGRPNILSIDLKKGMEKVVAGVGNYLAICSMNTSFKVKIVPAFYQLYMRYMDIDRFDDIWSGIFIKKIADHLGDYICLGKPILYHDKRPRTIWRDLKLELEGMIINEWLWRVVDEAEIDGSSYADAYISLANYIASRINELNNNIHKKFMRIQVEKMLLWIEMFDKLHLIK